MIRTAFILLLSLAASFAVAQTSETNTSSSNGRPDIPGTFVLELGLNRGLEAPSRFDLGFWGSRTINVYYQYEIPILKSRFSFVPGIGLSLERYKLKNLGVLGFDAEDSLKIFSPAEVGYTSLRKSQIITNYVDLPLELRYTSKPEDPGRSFKASIGGRIGYLYDSFNKLKYKEDGEMRKLKDKRNFNFNEIRYGVTARVGFGGFSVFGYYNLTPLFKEGKGLSENRIANDFPTFTVGISLASF